MIMLAISLDCLLFSIHFEHTLNVSLQLSGTQLLKALRLRSRCQVSRPCIVVHCIFSASSRHGGLSLFSLFHILRGFQRSWIFEHFWTIYFMFIHRIKFCGTFLDLLGFCLHSSIKIVILWSFSTSVVFRLSRFYSAFLNIFCLPFLDIFMKDSFPMQAEIDVLCNIRAEFWRV